MKYKLLMLIAALMLCFSAGAEGTLSVVCTDFPCYDFARQAAGDRAEVTLLLKPGVEAHSYEPTPSDIIAVGDANLFVYIGGESDAWADSILAGFDDDGPATLRMMDCVADLIEEEDDGHGLEYDEHIWTSPRHAAKMALAAGEALAGIDPEDAEYYRGNAAAYAGEIEAIDAQITDIVENAARRTLVFADRFPFIYFTRDYGLDYLAAFPSCTADTEPSAQVVMALIQKVAGERIPAVYTIELSTRAIAKTVAEETGAEILTLQSMQTVAQDDFDAGASWVSIMKENIEALSKGLN